MNGMELNVNYSILFLYTCGLAYYSVSCGLWVGFFFPLWLKKKKKEEEIIILDWWGDCEEGCKMQLDLGVCSFLFPAHAHTHTHKVTKWLMSLQVGVDIGYLIATVQIEY